VALMAGVRRRLKPRRGQLDPGDTMTLTIGPAPRAYYRDDWEAEEARLLGLWRLHGADLLAATPAGATRPWGYLAFEVAPDVRRRGAVQDQRVAEGLLSQAEANLSAAAEHLRIAGRVARGQPADAGANHPRRSSGDAGSSPGGRGAGSASPRGLTVLASTTPEPNGDRHRD
jgi:hypothetical protein